MADAEFPYISPPRSGNGKANEYMDAEPSGRAIDGIQVKLQRVVDRPAIERLEAVEARLVEARVLLTSIRDNTDTLEINAENVNVNLTDLEGLTAQVRDALTAFDTRIAGRDLASSASVAQARDAIVSALNAATDEEVAAIVTAFRNSFTSRDLATSARQDEMLVELRRKLNTGESVQMRPTLEQRQLAGYAFMASTGRINIATAGNFRATITVPATHTRSADLQRIVLFCSAGPAYGRLLINPTAGLPTTPARPVNNSRIGSPISSPVIVRADTSTATPISGGIDTGIDIPLPSGSRTVIDLSPLSIPPNVTLGINIPFVGPSDVVMTGYWYES